MSILSRPVESEQECFLPIPAYYGDAGYPVFALVCGLPEPSRSARVLGMLQAYFDDSADAGQALILAGYLASAEAWAKFSQEWQQQLSMRPRWKNFKMQEVAAANSDEGWERARHHYKIIKDHVFAEICIAVPVDDLVKAVDNLDFSLPKWAKDPYYTCWREVLNLTLAYLHAGNIKQPVDFYFDNQSQKSRIIKNWDRIKGGMRHREARIIRNPPAFRSDDDLMPLQAADFLAWWIRKRFRDTGSITSPAPIVPWENSAPDYDAIYVQHDLKSLINSLKETLGPKMRVSATYVRP